MKNLFITTLFLLVFISCKKKESTTEEPTPTPTPTVSCPTCNFPDTVWTSTASGPKLIFKFKFDSLDIVDNLINTKRFSLGVKKNVIIVFPSWLDHSSIINTNVEDRYCIGANYFLTDSLGKHESYNGYNRLDVNV